MDSKIAKVMSSSRKGHRPGKAGDGPVPEAAAVELPGRLVAAVAAASVRGLVHGVVVSLMTSRLQHTPRLVRICTLC